MDNPLKAELHRGRLGRDAELIKSPNIAGVKWDANEMLKAGVLVNFLAWRMNRVDLPVGVPA